MGNPYVVYRAHCADLNRFYTGYTIESKLRNGLTRDLIHQNEAAMRMALAERAFSLEILSAHKRPQAAEANWANRVRTEDVLSGAALNLLTKAPGSKFHPSFLALWHLPDVQHHLLDFVDGEKLPPLPYPERYAIWAASRKFAPAMRKRIRKYLPLHNFVYNAGTT